MSGFLASDHKPEGYSLVELLAALRRDLVLKTTKIVDDERPQAREVLENDIRILALLTECLHIAEASGKLLDRSFGKHVEGEPRIGVA